MTKIVVVAGTRPEFLKLGPVIDALRDRDVKTEIFYTNQSPDLIEDDVYADYIMDGRWNDLSDGIERVMYELKYRLMDADVDAVLVQGDTASAFAGALAAFLADVPVGHVEAGLRTYQRVPWPEEVFRHAIGSFARWHFCPDENARRNIMWEHGDPIHLPDDWEDEPIKWIDGRGVFVTGNPIIDTLPNQPFRVLVTLHRRENWGEPIERALRILKDFQVQNDVVVDVVRHPNWEAQDLELPSENGKFGIGDGCGHDEFLDWMQISDVVVTDSGGLQEEAAHFGVDCIVYREATERTALERSGAVEIVDPTQDPQKLRSALERRLRRREAYGNGDAGTKIADILVRELSERREPTERMKELADE